MLGRSKVAPARGGGFLKKAAIIFLLVAFGIGMLQVVAPWVDHLWDPTSYPDPNSVVEEAPAVEEPPAEPTE